MPNVEGTGAGNLTNNYRVQQKASTIRHNVDAKVNWNRTPAHQFWGKYSEMRAVVDDLFTFPIGESDDDGGHTNTYQVTAGQTWSLGPTLLLDSSFGILFNDQFVSSPDFHLGNIGLDLGIPGTNDQGRGDPRYAGMPQFSTGFTALGNTPTWSPIYMDQRDASFTTNLTKVSGKHDIRGGYAATYMKLDYWQPENANPRGSFTFATNATRTFGTGAQTGNFYNQYAAFLLGLVGTAGKSYQYELFTTREWQHALFVRDRWTPSPKLTLDLGLRWEYYPVMTRADRDIEMLDLTTLDVLIGGLGGNPKNMGLEAPKDAFAPRVGAVYRLNEKTVLRSGYGLTYDSQAMGAQVAFAGFQQYPLALNASYPPPAAQANFGWYGTLNDGIPRLEGPDISTRPRAAAERHRHAVGHAGNDAPRQDAFLERGIRAAPADCLRRRRVCGQQARRRPGPDQHEPRAAPRRGRDGSSVLRHRTGGSLPSTCISRIAGRITTRCRSARRGR